MINGDPQKRKYPLTDQFKMIDDQLELIEREIDET
jgi:hypothetical protein